MIYKIINYFLEEKIKKEYVFLLSNTKKEIKKNEELLQKIKDKNDVAIKLAYGGNGKECEEILANLKKVPTFYKKYQSLISISDSKRRYILNTNYLQYLYSQNNLRKVSNGINWSVFSPQEVNQMFNDRLPDLHKIKKVEDSLNELSKKLL